MTGLFQTNLFFNIIFSTPQGKVLQWVDDIYFQLVPFSGLHLDCIDRTIII